MDKNKKVKIIKYTGITGVILIPIMVVLVFVLCRNIINPSNEEIIEKVKELKSYSADLSYTVINKRGNYTEDIRLFYSSDNGARLEFGQDKVKIFKGDKIKINEKTLKDSYEIDRNLDVFYQIGFINNILSNKIVSIEEAQQEWGELVYLEVTVKINSNNKHISTGKIFIEKKEYTPIGIKIYDDEENERIIISYKNFKKEKELDKKLF